MINEEQLLKNIFQCRKCGKYHTNKVWVENTSKYLENIGIIINNIPILTKKLLKEGEKYIYICPNCKKVCTLEDIMYLPKSISNALKKEISIKNLLENNQIDYEYFSNTLKENSIGDWSQVVTSDTLKTYITFEIVKRINSTALLSAVDNKHKYTKHWIYDIKNPITAPIPITSKRGLVYALGLNEKSLNKKIICLV